MPNYAFNHLTINSADKKTIEDIEAFVMEPLKGGGKSFSLNRVIPMPESLNVEEGSRTDDRLRYYCLKVCMELPKFLGMTAINSLDFSKKEDGSLYSAKEYEERFKFCESDFAEGQKIYNNIVNYGSKTWYSWCCNNWNTKWDAFDSDSEFSYSVLGDGSHETFITFLTAWDAPFPVIEALSEKFPKAEFTLHTSYEGGEDDTKVVYRNGNELSFTETPCSLYDECGEDE